MFWKRRWRNSFTNFCSFTFTHNNSVLLTHSQSKHWFWRIFFFLLRNWIIYLNTKATLIMILWLNTLSVLFHLMSRHTFRKLSDKICINTLYLMKTMATSCHLSIIETSRHWWSLLCSFVIHPVISSENSMNCCSCLFCLLRAPLDQPWSGLWHI